MRRKLFAGNWKMNLTPSRRRDADRRAPRQISIPMRRRSRAIARYGRAASLSIPAAAQALAGSNDRAGRAEHAFRG